MAVVLGVELGHFAIERLSDGLGALVAVVAEAIERLLLVIPWLVALRVVAVVHLQVDLR
jgi:hypothetical protein